jgi:hypothetical protein
MTKSLALGLARWCLLLVVAGAPGRALAEGDAPGAASAEASRIEQQARAAAQAGYCETAANAVGRLAAIDPDRHAALQKESAIETCAARVAEGVRAAPLRGLTAGARVRVQLATGRVVGAFAGVRGGEVLIDEGGGAPAAIRLDDLRVVERSRGKESHALSGLRWGLLAGATVGVLATLAIGQGGDEEQYMPEYTLLPPAAIGALIGLVLGATRSTERWEPIARW